MDERGGVGRDEDERDVPEQGVAEQRIEEGDLVARYYETESERLLVFERDGRRAVLAQNLEGYAMVKVRRETAGDELERYYGFDIALDHAAELLGVELSALPVPERAASMGM